LQKKKELRREFGPEQRITQAWQPKLCRLLAEKTIDVLISVFIASSLLLYS
jgi:hypothetical protein